MKRIAVFGGKSDPNVRSFCEYLRLQAVDYHACLYTVGAPIDLTLDINRNILWVNSAPLETEAAFFRKDVFSYLNNKKNPRLMAYATTLHDVVKQYLLYNRDIRIINRTFLLQGGTNKLFNLLKAQEFGFLIPETLVSSNLDRIREFVSTHETIQKPVSGGDHAKGLKEEQLDRYHTHFPVPHKVQQRMNQPEVRVYRIGEIFLSFHLQYEGLDYRTHNRVSIEKIPNDHALCAKLGHLTDFLGMDYAAADFMTDNQGRLTFLEVNSFPMFARFDKESGYAVSEAIFNVLMQRVLT